MTNDPTNDFDKVVLGDARLNLRARKLLWRLSLQPAAGVPSVLTDAELEGYYRFVNNECVTFEALLAAHRGATKRRVGSRERLVVAHDTSDFRFSDEVAREGLGPMDNGGQGFYAHFSLAVAERRQAFGVVAVEPWTRTSRTSAKRSQRERYLDPAKESLRWARGVRAAEAVFAGGPRLIHVMDREADDYDILSELTDLKVGFVIRASFDRRLETSPKKLKSFARAMDVQFEREAQLSSRRKNRPAKQRKLYPPRESRVATLALASSSVTLRRPDKSVSKLETLTLNVVHVHEPCPPQSCEPVEWILLTSEPVDTAEQILQVVDDYRARWVIEEYFKALKTGCAYEKRQNETKVALLNALGIYLPIAWSLLNMRTLSRNEESSAQPAEEVFTATQLQILRMESNGKLSMLPTIGEAILLMARIFGGLQKSNGLPGWQILGRAFEKLLQMEAGWRLSLAYAASPLQQDSVIVSDRFD